jgi:hypothetical protein
MAELYRRTHNVSHFQIDLVSKGSPLSEHDVGGTLAAFAPGHINVATAWDENGTVPPHVDISISGYEPLPAVGIAELIPVAAGFLDVGPDGVEVGNFITSDVSAVALPKGRYAVTVFLETLEPMAARRVHFHLRTTP